MIIRFLKKLFCFHDYEQEESLTTNEYFEVCKKCNKVRKIKVLFGLIQEIVMSNVWFIGDKIGRAHV